MAGVKIVGFPNPVNEVSARLVAAGVVVLATITIAFDVRWLTLALAYGFVARVLTGPKLSPLGQLVTRVITPALDLEPRLVPGPPKRFAQGVGAAFTVTAAALTYGADRFDLAQLVLGALVIAASLEAFLGFCLGCKAFAILMRIGMIPERICEECNDIWSRRPSGSRASVPTAAP
ncbi:MAG: DUF4395 domain-containing protein [Actinomycetota bacterium]